MDVDINFFSFKYSFPLSTSESRAKTQLPDSFECFFDPQRSFGNPLRALFLKNRNFFCYGEIFLPNTRGPLGCPLWFWPSGPKPCGGNKYFKNSNNSLQFCKMRATLLVDLLYIMLGDEYHVNIT